MGEISLPSQFISNKDMVVPQVNLEKMFSMEGGNGESSYVNNSKAQAKHAQALLHLLQGALDVIHLPSPDTPFTVADLGCSCGNNTLVIMDEIIRYVTKRYQFFGLSPPEFQAFFSDLPSNDFNNLFQLLPPLNLDDNGGLLLIEEGDGKESYRPYFAVGVPGSFYRRLFPRRSMDFIHSAFSLHWLSQVPNAVVDKTSPAYNKGRIFIHGSSTASAMAYREQFQKDLGSFLQLRAQEMKIGGSMYLAFFGRRSGNPTDQDGPGLLFGTHFEDSWEELVQKGMLDEEKRDSFNLPVYAASLQDVREVVESQGLFTVNKLDIVKGGSPLVVNRQEDAIEVGEALAKSCRAVCGVLVEAHIGTQLSNELFNLLQRRATLHAKDLIDKIQFFHIVASLSLKSQI